jgi:hypothetical protein
MRIVDIRERPVRISRYRDPHIPSGGLTTSLVAVVTDVARAGWPVVGYGFASIGRYAQSGLIRERFGPRLLRAATQDISTDGGATDPAARHKEAGAAEGATAPGRAERPAPSDMTNLSAGGPDRSRKPRVSRDALPAAGQLGRVTWSEA